MSSSLKLVLFIDVQNSYRGARRTFFSDAASSVDGQFDPLKLGRLIESRGGPNNALSTLAEVRAYTGRPDSRKDPKTYDAHMNQCEKWQLDGVQIIHRVLRYPRGWPDQRAQEKGIDTALAIDFVTMAVDEAFDIGVIMSTDTDLLPALEFVRSGFIGKRHVATAAWSGPQGNRRLFVQGANIWCHWLNRDDYEAVADLTDYSR